MSQEATALEQVSSTDMSKSSVSNRPDAEKPQKSTVAQDGLLREVEPLATPKGQPMPKCKLCDASAKLICKECKTPYCNLKHAEDDGIHSYVCQDLTEIQELQAFVPPNAQERNRIIKLCRQKTIDSGNRMNKVAMNFLACKEPGQALRAATYSMLTSEKVLGYEHEESIIRKLMVICCYIRLAKFDMASNCLSQVKHQILTRQETSPPVVGEYHKMFGSMTLKQNLCSTAISHFSDEVYLISTHFGVHHHRTALSMWRLGKGFFRQEKILVADSMFRQSVTIWLDFMKEIFAEQKKREEQANLAVVKIGAETAVKGLTLMDETVKSEGREMLKEILEARETRTGMGKVEDLILTTLAYGQHLMALGNFRLAFGIMKKCMKYNMLDSTTAVSKEVKEDILKHFKRCRRSSWSQEQK